MNPKDAEMRGIQKGDIVTLKSPYGEMMVKAKPTKLVPSGIVGVMHGWAKANVNELIPRQFDPVSGFPPYKETICNVLKA
jgi:anaerobic selenocysteine-containing dehydrogenase